ncbi:hypothetical protein E1A91_D01G138100v1 [Gossypium mustelinum]|uniref:MADS-box domain-containing protein n=1 Tax=Gossypium mustelinum TaxID=34275 RepID=A0A5D2W6Z0_GOSMU|nr:hypothetical protein E1A91_D01G138100v1 [Gossypium mustelinum]
MAIKKVKLAWIENNSTRKASLKKQRLGLVKKVESTTLSFGSDGPSFNGSSNAAPNHGLLPFKTFSEGQF